MPSQDLIKKIRRIEIKSNKLVEEIFSGEYRSSFKGRGIEFEDIRQYYPGDEVRNIEWKVTARQNQAFVKQFREERELNMFLLIDMSHSNSLGEKKDIIAEIGATLAFSAIKNNDKVGAILFTETVEKLIPSQSGKKHVLSIIEEILRFKPQKKATRIKNALQYFNRIEKKQSIVFLISDFLDDDYQRDLKITASKHDLVLIRVIDKLEKKIPGGAIFEFEDLETGETIIVDNLKQELKLDNVQNFPSRNLIDVYTDQDFVKSLQAFFKRRISS